MLEIGDADRKLHTAMLDGIPRDHLISPPFAEPGRLRSRDIFGLLSRSWPFTRPYRRDLVCLFLMLLPGAAAGLFSLMMIRIFFDVIGNGRPLTAHEAWLLSLPLSATRQMVLARACLVGGAAALAALPYVLFVFGYTVWILQKISNLFRVNLFAQLQELSLSFHSQEKIGDAIFRMFQDSAGIPHVINGLLLQPLRLVPIAIANLGWLIIFNYTMALIALILLPAEFVLAWTFSASLRNAFLRARETSALATTRIEETLASIKAVKSFGRENYEAAVYADESWAALLAERTARMRWLTYCVLSNFLGGLAYLTVIYIGARQVVTSHAIGIASSALSLGLFQATVLSFSRIAGSAHELGTMWGSLQDVGVGFARVFQILGQQSERVTAAQHLNRRKASPSSIRRTVAFEGVSFGYGSGVSVLNGVDFEARAGELTVVMGPSGTGKSTMIALLLRFFEPGSGRILLDGSDIREFELDAWRQMVAVALQNNPLLTGTLHENVAYGRADATLAEVRSALDKVALGDYLDSLPAGLNTMLGEKGANLSTGQAQRIAVARALLRDAPILLLDEPSSALDVTNEERVMRTIRGWLAEQSRRRLAIMMTHRRTAAAWADRVYTVRDGSLIEERHRADLESPMDVVNVSSLVSTTRR
jgi:ATP-binding cassette, subfamily B, bacterial